MIEVTAGLKYMDIDAYAGCIAYAKLLSTLGYQAIATNSADNINNSVVPSFYNMKYKMIQTQNYSNKFIILDVCNPKMINETILNKNILEVIDHHPYYEYVDYWKKRKTKLILEDIGSICTIIFEKIISNNKVEILDKDLCKLLIAGILDNTLNLKASITSQRDIEAYNQLMCIGNIEKDFAYNYFKECQNMYEQNLLESIENDLKTEASFPYIPKIVGQLLVIDIHSILRRKKEIENYMNINYKSWMINFINIFDGKSYILTDSSITLNNLKKIIDGTVENNKLLILDSFMLRKEIFRTSLKFK